MENPESGIEASVPPTKPTLHRWRIPLVLGVFAVLCVGAVYARFRGGKTMLPSTEMLMTKHESLKLSDISPRGNTILPEKITFTFSEAVDPDQFQKFFEILPMIEGSVSIGSNPTEIVFTPKMPFPRGIRILTNVGAGLHSKSGKMLQNDEINTFNTQLASNEVKFISDNFTGRVMSFQAGSEMNITVKSGTNVNKSTVNVYRSTQANLLNYLLYKKTLHREGSSTYTYTTEEYLKEYITHTEKQRIDSFEVAGSDFSKKLTLPVGIYYLEADASDKSPVGSTFLIVNSTGISARFDDQLMILSVFDLASSKNIDATVYAGLYTLENVPSQITTTTFNGIKNDINLTKARIDAVIATVNGETVFTPVSLPQSMADIRNTQDLNTTYRGFVYTDRPIYQPNDVVQFKGILRTDKDSLYDLPPSNISLRVYSQDSAGKWLDQIVTTNAHGEFYGSFKAPAELSSQWEKTRSFNVSLATADTSVYQSVLAYATFDDISYTKPDFEIGVKTEKAEYFRTDPISFTFTGKQLDGKPLADQDVDYTLYTLPFYEIQKAVYNQNFNIVSAGGMCGGGGFGDDYNGEEVIKSTAKLDANGEGTILAQIPEKFEGSQQLTLVVSRKDQSGNIISSAAKTVVHSSDAILFYPPSNSTVNPGSTIRVPVNAETLGGKKLANVPVKLTVVNYVYTSGSEKKEEESTQEKMTNENGEVVFDVTIAPSKTSSSRTLVASTTDESGRVSQVSKYLYVPYVDSTSSQYVSRWSSDRSDTYLKIYSPKNSFIVGETAALMVTSPKDMDVLLSYERGRIYTPRIIHLQAGENTVTIPITSELSPSITPTFSFFADGQYHSEGLDLNVPAMHKLLSVVVTPDKTSYLPTETVTLRVHITDAQNNPVKANFSLGVVDKAIYALRKSATPPIHSSFFYFRPRTTSSSSSLTWIGTLDFGGRGGGGGGGGNGLTRPVDTLYWKPALETDENGDATIQIPFNGIEGAWRAQVIAATDQTDVGQSTSDFTSFTQSVLP